MESTDFGEDSQLESVAVSDDSRNTIVPETIGDGGEDVDDTALIVEDSGDEGKGSAEAIVDFRGLKSRLRTTPQKVIHDFDLNQPSVEERLLAAKYKGERDFDLNKLPIAGVFTLTDPTREPYFIEMLRLLVPSFY